MTRRPPRRRCEPESSGHHMVVAPLTGLYYTAPSPDAAPYVRGRRPGRRRPGHRPDRGHEAVQRDQERRRRPRRAHLRPRTASSSRPSSRSSRSSRVERREAGSDATSQRPDHGLGDVRAGARADQRRPRAAGRHVRRVDRSADGHPRAARRRAARDDGHAGGHRRQARHRRGRPRARRHRPHPGGDADARLLDALDRRRWSRRPSATPRAAAMDVMAACSGFVYAYAMADAYIRSGMYRNALVCRRRAAHALPRLHRPQHLHPLRRWRRRRRRVGLGRGGRRHGRPGADDRPRRRLHDLAAIGRLAQPGQPGDDPRAASTTCAWKARRPTATRPRRWPRRR